MTDDERLARLTELARRVWPDAAEVELASYGAESAPASIVWSHDDQLARIEHPRALDALEAALLALAGEPPACPKCGHRGER